MANVVSRRIGIARRLADAFNRRDIEQALALLSDDVDWPNVREGRRLRGRDAVREYWLAQWEVTQPHIEPRQLEPFDDRLIVSVRQRVTDKGGSQIVDHVIAHVLAFEGDRIARLDVYPSREQALSALSGAD
jgi:hypothetical protein